MAKIMTERRRAPEEVAALRNKPPAKKLKPPKALASVVTTTIDRKIGLLFWKLRNLLPDMAITISEDDIRSMDDSMTYCEQSPKLVVEAGQQFVVIRIADAKTGDMIRVEENSEENLRAKNVAAQVRKAKEQLPNQIAVVRGELANGITSEDSIKALCANAQLLAQQ